MQEKRIALVTGGGTGIGRGIALALARRGMDVALVGRRAAPLEAVAQEVSALGARGVALPTDVTVASERAALIERVHAALGLLDLLVNNAGMMAGGDLVTLSAEEIEQAVALNLTAPMDLTRLALPDLAASRGAVVLVASAVSHVPLPSGSLYTATKTGLRAFGETLRYELEPLGVHLLIAYPPAVKTAMTAGMAAAAGVPIFPMLAPEKAGERIVSALFAHKRELQFGFSEQTTAHLYKIAPWLVKLGLRSQRRRFSRMMKAVRLNRREPTNG
ncbi:MAG TPA: SDR family NAD(P)-dependent oxidoreductase [Ktedonobacterales bacterium]|jgi:short-subunit dehydrogenase